MDNLVFIQRIHILGKGAGLFYLYPWLGQESPISLEALWGVALRFSPGAVVGDTEDVFLVTSVAGFYWDPAGRGQGDLHTPTTAGLAPTMRNYVAQDSSACVEKPWFIF